MNSTTQTKQQTLKPPKHQTINKHPTPKGKTFTKQQDNPKHYTSQSR